MARLIIQGGKRIQGKHRPPGTKNAALPMLAACVLTDETVRLQNIPLIDDVRTMLEILEDLGVSVTLKGHTVTLCAAGLRKSRLHPDLCRRVRSSILFAGPLTARLGRATLFPPGGDVIGRRRVDTHLEGLHALGIRTVADGHYTFRRQFLRGADLVLDEASVTATENIVMAAVLAEGTTSIFNAACEPHVQDLCQMLNKMGAGISGIGTNRLVIEGVPTLHGVTHRVLPDSIDAASFIAAAVLTGGSLEVEDISAGEFSILRRPFQKLGLQWTIDQNTLFVPSSRTLRVQNDLGSAIPKIEDGIWPNFPSDLMSVAIVLATQAKGTLLFFEKMFESRMYFVDRLIEMGARIVQCDPHRVVISGPAPLRGIHMSSPDIRAGMALLLGALCAKGESIIDNAQSIDRGYERIEQKFQNLGADIVRIE